MEVAETGKQIAEADKQPLPDKQSPPIEEEDDQFALLWAFAPVVAFLIITAALYAGREILLPLAMAVILAVIFSPVATRLERYVGPLLSSSIVVLVVIGFMTAMVYFLGPWSALMVVLIHKGVGGAYMASVFAPNHKGMPQTDSATRMDFVRTQVLTARNVRGHPLTELWYGSLNYQIEHHLFPGMPRLNMRRAQPIIRQFCVEHGIEYYETSFLDSYRELLAFLNEIGAPLRAEGIRV